MVLKYKGAYEIKTSQVKVCRGLADLVYLMSDLLRM
jgi:hypothetical protein